jgi:hypothetical protein
MTHVPQRDLLLPHLARLREQIVELHPDAAEDTELFLATVDGETNGADALRTVCRYALEAETFAQALNTRIAEMRARRDRFLAKAAACRATARDGMDALGLKVLPAEDFSASVGAGPLSVMVTDLDALPSEFKRIKIEPDKIAIGKVLKGGTRIAGAELSNGGSVLTLRRS